jgi:hypothetical protein
MFREKSLLVNISMWLLGNEFTSLNLPIFEQTYLVGQRHLVLLCDGETSYFFMV